MSSQLQIINCSRVAFEFHFDMYFQVVSGGFMSLAKRVETPAILNCHLQRGVKGFFQKTERIQKIAFPGAVGADKNRQGIEFHVAKLDALVVSELNSCDRSSTGHKPILHSKCTVKAMIDRIKGLARWFVHFACALKIIIGA